jgi:nitroreductase
MRRGLRQRASLEHHTGRRPGARGPGGNGVITAEAIVDFFEAVRARRSVRSYRGDAVDAADLERICAAINAAPSAGNLQAYEVYLVTDEGRRGALARAAYDQGFLVEAPVVLVFCAHEARARRYGERGARLYTIQDATIAAAYAQLAAVSLGLSTCWVGAFEEQKVVEALRLPEGQRPIIMLPVGTAREVPEPTPRRPPGDLIHRI